MKILFVCLGNICRSPLADGLLRAKVASNNLEVLVDSAGTSGHHIGEAPDLRMQKTAKQFGHAIDNLRARQFTSGDFAHFDLIYAMDRQNFKDILSLAESDEHRSKVKLILNELYPGQDLEVPDPYFGGEQGFREVFTLLDKATNQIIHNLQQNG